MFRSMFDVIMSYLSNSFLLPFWISCGAVVVAGAAAVVIKGVFARV